VQDLGISIFCGSQNNPYGQKTRSYGFLRNLSGGVENILII